MCSRAGGLNEKLDATSRSLARLHLIRRLQTSAKLNGLALRQVCVRFVSFAVRWVLAYCLWSLPPLCRYTADAIALVARFWHSSALLRPQGGVFYRNGFPPVTAIVAPDT